MRYFCCQHGRREAVQKQDSWNGIDYLEVLDKVDPALCEPQRILSVHFLKPLNGSLQKKNVRTDGGDRIRDIGVLEAKIGTGENSDVLTVEVDKAGDFSTYTLRLVAGADSDEPPDKFDPILSAVDFSFKVECPTDFDCRTPRVCPAEPRRRPEINYLAKDYASFRRLLFDRLATLSPHWQERNPADLGVALVELLAYVGDYLSYQQDAVATEAYLDTARRRVSVRRHARLVDYFMHNGCNARAWVQVQVESSGGGTGGAIELPQGTQLLTRVVGFPAHIDLPGSEPYQRALEQRPLVFETMRDETLFADHNEMPFYTWGDRGCCLPRGATRATLFGDLPNLKPGDVVILAELKDAGTGRPEDADPTRRHPVRLTHVKPTDDPLGGQFLESPSNDAVPVTEIRWSDADALPFPLCLSGSTDEYDYDDRLSVAWGNIVLADHGRTREDVPLGAVPRPHLSWPSQGDTADRCRDCPPEYVPARYRPSLPDRPLTHAAPLPNEFFFRIEGDGRATELHERRLSKDLENAFADRGVVFDKARLSVKDTGAYWSVSDGEKTFAVRADGERQDVFSLREPAVNIFRQSPAQAIPAAKLADALPGSDREQSWSARRDLLDSGGNDTHFVVEVEDDGTALLRFGDDHHGKRPEPGTEFTTRYRVGNGPAGNVGAEAIAHCVTADASISRVWNPLPAAGGTEPETIEHVRQDAPRAFRIQQRAVTPDDYARVAERHAGIQQAAATLRWTGSWHTVFVTVDRLGGAPVDPDFEESLRAHLERFRMAGYDLEVDGPQYVPLEVEMYVGVEQDYFRGHVKRALLDVFHNRVLSDGRLGVFHPDNFTFGQTVYLSHLYAAAEAVAGVAVADITKFQRMGREDPSPLSEGKVELGRLEIARLDNDPNYPERGVFRLNMGGGR